MCHGSMVPACDDEDDEDGGAFHRLSHASVVSFL